MDEDIGQHQPSETARRRARAAGVDLDSLRAQDPDSYRMLCSVAVVTVALRLHRHAEAPLQETLTDQRLFQVERGDKILYLAFPGPDREQLARLDGRLAQIAEGFASEFAFYREVNDRSGTRRELALPVTPDAGKRLATAEEPFEAFVGPFADEGSARSWGDSHVDGARGFTCDVLHYLGAWFSDVFRAEM